MVRAKKTNVNNTINIKFLPVQCHIGASKFINDDWGTIAFSIPRNQIQNKFADPELISNDVLVVAEEQRPQWQYYESEVIRHHDR